MPTSPSGGVRIGQWTLDVRDVAPMAQFWAAALGYEIGDDGQHLWPPDDAGPQALSVWLQPVDAPTPGKVRGHPDLVPRNGDTDAEVERLLALGARHADVGQTGEEGFVVLTDPEGNAFCVLRGREPDE
jgi:Glyoxalase-like domain